MSLEISRATLVEHIKRSAMVLVLVIFIGNVISLLLGIELKASLLDSINVFLGVCAAIFGNISGAGGGMVFIPVFGYFELTPPQMLATSFGIQCFGMTAGAVTWYLHYRRGHSDDPTWAPLGTIVGIVSVTAIAGTWSVYGGFTDAPASLHDVFSVFSVILGAFLLFQVLVLRPKIQLHKTLDRLDYLAFVIIGYFGGIVTAWLSVGVGEILVLYLIIRRFCTTMAVAAAVIVTAFTVWSAAIEHLIIGNQAAWNIILFAGPGAVIGGILARSIAGSITTKSLKVVLASWILLMGLVTW